jgi:outer membrane protein OmpA-like peptidoglycan-associated protein
VWLSWPAASVAEPAGSLPVEAQWGIDGGSLTVEVLANDRIDELEISVRRVSDGRVFRQRAGTVASMGTARVTLPAPSSTTRYVATITGTHAGDRGSLEMAFEVAVAADLEFRMIPGTYEVEAGRFRMTMNQPAGHVEILVRDDEGSVLAQRSIAFAGEPAGTPLNVSWVQGPGRVLTLDVKAFSADGAWSAAQFIPWKVDYTVAGIHFATGSAEIPAEDFELLNGFYDRIAGTVARVRRWVGVELYIAGHTDTVGNAEDNRRLSDERAESLARYFAAKGLDIPIHVHGFGESAPIKETGDDVDEPENRRAQCILSVGPPPSGPGLPPSGWRRISR